MKQFLDYLKGILETEVNVYFKLVPELTALRATMPKTFPFIWGDCKSTSKEILLLENLECRGFQSAIQSPEGTMFNFILSKVYGYFYLKENKHYVY